MIQFENISASYDGKTKVIEEITFSINQQQLLASSDQMGQENQPLLKLHCI